MVFHFPQELHEPRQPSLLRRIARARAPRRQDKALEAEIKHAVERATKAHEGGYLRTARYHWKRVARLISQRRPEVVARIEREKGLRPKR